MKPGYFEMVMPRGIVKCEARWDDPATAGKLTLWTDSALTEVEWQMCWESAKRTHIYSVIEADDPPDAADSAAWERREAQVRAWLYPLPSS